MTTVPDLQTPTPTLNLRGFVPPTLRLHPVVDDMADKLCATQSTYGAAGDRPSSRVRDLVDLVVFARSQDVDGDALINAIRAKWNHQGLAGDPLFDPQRTGGGGTHRWPGPCASASEVHATENS